MSATSAIDMLVVRILSPASFAPLPRFRFLSAEKRNSIYNNTAPRFIYLIGLISSFINSRNHSSKASLKPFTIEESSGYFYAILLCKIAADGKPVILFISHLPVRSPQFSSLETSPSLCTTKGLAPFGIPDYLHILIF